MAFLKFLNKPVEKVGGSSKVIATRTGMSHASTPETGSGYKKPALEARETAKPTSWKPPVVAGKVASTTALVGGTALVVGAGALREYDYLKDIKAKSNMTRDMEAQYEVYQKAMEDQRDAVKNAADQSSQTPSFMDWYGQNRDSQADQAKAGAELGGKALTAGAVLGVGILALLFYKSSKKRGK